MPHTHDLAILDIMMPQMNGLESMREIKRVDEIVKICLLTALSKLSEYATDIKKIRPTLN
jgi:DNA-binding response OmpR family regulator